NSNLRLPRPQPAIRPSEFPFEVLWQKDDCKHDTYGARPIESNSGRPRMKMAIRNRDGTLEEQERLKKSLPMKQISKKYFENVRPKQWKHAIAVLEDHYPVLTYGAAHWKAEQLLATQLTSKRTHQKKAGGGGHKSKKAKRSAKSGEKDDNSSESDSEEENSEEEEDDGGRREKAATGSKRKRATPSDAPATPAQNIAMNLDPVKRVDANMPPHAIELLDALEKISGSAVLDSGTPSPTVIQFIEHIESADPTAPDIDEDDTNIGWGHYQFTSGGLNCRSALKAWSDIGNVKTA
ncbi:hypothetical protein BJ912DRAFT_837916, partial [Pholiota molesta]